MGELIQSLWTEPEREMEAGLWRNKLNIWSRHDWNWFLSWISHLCEGNEKGNLLSYKTLDVFIVTQKQRSWLIIQYLRNVTIWVTLKLLLGFHTDSAISTNCVRIKVEKCKSFFKEYLLCQIGPDTILGTTGHLKRQAKILALKDLKVHYVDTSNFIRK